MSSVKMFESISGECQPIFALEKAFRVCLFQGGSTGCLASRNKKSRGELFERPWVIFFFFLMSSDLCKDLSFSREQKSMCPIRVPCFKSLGRLVAAEMNLQGRCFLCYSRDLTLTLSLGCPEPDRGEATSTVKMSVQFPWSVLLSLPQTSFSTLLLPLSECLMPSCCPSLGQIIASNTPQERKWSHSVMSNSLWPHGQ